MRKLQIDYKIGSKELDSESLDFLSWFRLQRREDCDSERTTKRRTKLTRHDLAFVVVLQRFQIPAAASSAVWEKDGSEAPSVASWRILPEFLGYSFRNICFLLAFYPRIYQQKHRTTQSSTSFFCIWITLLIIVSLAHLFFQLLCVLSSQEKASKNLVKLQTISVEFEFQTASSTSAHINNLLLLCITLSSFSSGLFSSRSPQSRKSDEKNV
jgi:hypothetical protein